jgi:bifunctional lysine-specific demethylase and histidyl-hydroxylase NO66
MTTGTRATATPRTMPAKREAWRDDPIGFLTAPMQRADFLENVHERASLVRRHGDPGRFADLLSIEMIDDFIAGTGLREGMIDLASQRGRPAPGSYIGADGRVNRAVIAEEYLKGATIILPQLHESLFRLADFCRALEAVFSCHVQTNVYLTPSNSEGEGNQGFPIHYDNHDVFVLQVSGAKAWRLYDMPVENPFRGEGFELGQHEAGPLRESFTLEAGDCLYVPRGLMHDAENVGDAPSLHITVGLITKTWADLMLEAVSELALTEADFRRSLPAGYANRDFDREEARRHFDKLTRLIAEKASIDGAFDLLADSFLRGRQPNMTGVIGEVPPAAGDGRRYRRRAMAPWTVADDEGEIALIGPGGDLLFKPEEAEALQTALFGDPFRIEDLPCPDPAGLVRRLWANGYLERCGERARA